MITLLLHLFVVVLLDFELLRHRRLLSAFLVFVYRGQHADSRCRSTSPQNLAESAGASGPAICRGPTGGGLRSRRRSLLLRLELDKRFLFTRLRVEEKDGTTGGLATMLAGATKSMRTNTWHSPS